MTEYYPFLTENGYNFANIQLVSCKSQVFNVNNKSVLDNISSNIRIDPVTLAHFACNSTPAALRCLLVLIERLEVNNKPVFCPPSVFSDKLGMIRGSIKFYKGLKQLEEHKMIFRVKKNYNYYYINPLVAWTGERAAYFDRSTLPYVSRAPSLE